LALLKGDRTREENHQCQRAIWEAHPENLVYLGNYISYLTAGPATKSDQWDFCHQEISAARKLDPDNARYSYLEAAILLKGASEIKSESVGKDEEGKKIMEHSLQVLDRKKLDEAMAILLQGTEKPYLRRYAKAMLRERLDILGPPHRLVDMVQRTALAASVLLPDLSLYRDLIRTSSRYAELLVAEGNEEAAVPFLETGHIVSIQLHQDSFTLIDILVVAALSAETENSAVPLYRQMGREADAELAIRKAATVSGPVKEWRNQTRAGENNENKSRNDRILDEHAGILPKLLIPAIGRWPTAEEYKPERMLEYTVFTEFLVFIVSILLLIALLSCLGMNLWWRCRKPTGAPSVQTDFPNLREIVRMLCLYLILPWTVFFLATRFIPLSGHYYSINFGMHKLIAEFGLLVAALIILPIIRTWHMARIKCRECELPTQQGPYRFIKWPLGIGILGLILVWCMTPTGKETAQYIAAGAAALVGICLIISALIALAQGIVGDKRYGPFHDTARRSLIPTLAFVILAMGLVVKPLLLHSEARYLAQDTILYDAHRPGFTNIENDLVDDLRNQITKAVKDLENTSNQTPLEGTK